MEKKLTIINSPQILVIHISRFDSGLEKIDTFVEFPIELTTEYIRDGNGQQTTYRLTGMVFHGGPSIAQGHYISYVLIDGNWYEANDTVMKPVLWETMRLLQAYMLFYVRL